MPQSFIFDPHSSRL